MLGIVPTVTGSAPLSSDVPSSLVAVHLTEYDSPSVKPVIVIGLEFAELIFGLLSSGILVAVHVYGDTPLAAAVRSDVGSNSTVNSELTPLETDVIVGELGLLSGFTVLLDAVDNKVDHPA